MGGSVDWNFVGIGGGEQGDGGDRVRGASGRSIVVERAMEGSIGGDGGGVGRVFTVGGACGDL